MTTIMDLWGEATSELRWVRLPDRAFDLVEARGYPLSLSPEEWEFLTRMLADPSPRIVVSAVRLLGSLGEEGMTEALQPIHEALTSSHAYIRNAATEALWQMGSASSKPQLEEAAARETRPAVKRTMEYVLGLWT